ncbi:hypothetical protein [Plantactinospora sp. BC1]|uniref:hypothetical protein n=1 Tax=Plantactinospora sp. BC1 TaxID=2108470 RepID=UPI00131EFB20|nr:hypothetical protein [Plantactinospora sp. BC1]
MTYKNLRPAQVVLDSRNPRLPDGTSSDRDAINRLLDEGADALINLARDMAKSGQTNPAELPIAIKDGSKYIVLEGNRRFAALKLLNDPALANNEEHEAAFRRARALGAPPKTVFTLISDSREEADHWIVLRHTGENNGRGVKRWSTAQAATHARRANKSSIDSGTLRSIAIADEVEAAYAGDAELVALVRQVRREKLTNIGRLFSLDVLNRLHFSVQVDEGSALRERILLTRHTRGDLRDLFVWAFSLILDKSVDVFKNPEKRRELLLTIPHLLPNDADASATPFRLAEDSVNTSFSAANRSNEPDDERTEFDGENDADDGSNSGNGDSGQAGTTSSGTTTSGTGDASRSSSKRRESRPERYLLQGLKLPNHPDRIQKLLQECRRLEIEVFPSIACVMMRVIVELSVSSPSALVLTGKREGDPLKDKIVSMLKFLDPDIEHSRRRDKELEQAYIEVTGDSTASNAPAGPGMQYLNGFVHNPGVNPDPHLARRFSTAFRPLLIQIDNKL